MSDKETAYVLSDDATATVGEYVTVAGFPGRFLAGEAVPVSALGIEAREADRLIREGNLPLKKTTAAGVPAGTFISGADVASTSETEHAADLSPMPGLTQADFDARLAEERAIAKDDPRRPVSPVLEAAAAGRSSGALVAHVSTEGSKAEPLVKTEPAS